MYQIPTHRQNQNARGNLTNLIIGVTRGVIGVTTPHPPTHYIGNYKKGYLMPLKIQNFFIDFENVLGKF